MLRGQLFLIFLEQFLEITKDSQEKIYGRRNKYLKHDKFSQSATKQKKNEKNERSIITFKKKKKLRKAESNKPKRRRRRKKKQQQQNGTILETRYIRAWRKPKQKLPAEQKRLNGPSTKRERPIPPRQVNETIKELNILYFACSSMLQKHGH